MGLHFPLVRPHCRPDWHAVGATALPTLDRMIARQFAVNALVLMLILGSFVVAVDASLNLDRYARAAGDSAGTVGRIVATLGVIWSTWWPRLLQIYNFTLGFVLAAALGFTCTQLVVRREMVAMLAGGISLRRAMAPILAVCAAFFALAVANQELVIPRIAPMLVGQGVDGARGGALGVTALPTTSDASGRLFFARAFDPQQGTLEHPTIWERDQRGVPTHRIVADAARWDGSAWMLENGRALPVGRPAPAEPLERVTTDLDPGALAVRRFAGLGQNLGFFELGRMLAQDRSLTPDLRRRLERDRWGRVGSWLATGLALVMAIPFFAVRQPTNMAVQAAKCAPIVLAALVLAVLGVSTPVAGMPGWLSVFLPAAVLLPAAAAAVTSIQT